MKKVFIFIILFIIFDRPNLTNAQVVISEIMYDLEGTDTDREWIEIQNTGSAEVDIASWKFFEGNTNHGLVPDSASKIPPGGYGIIVTKVESFKADWPNFTGLIFDSSFSLNNDPGETLAIKDGTGTIIDQVAYIADPTGAKAGKSLQKAGSMWVTAAPTVGAANATTSDSDASGGNADGSTGGGSSITEESPVKKSAEVTVPKISAEILGTTSAIVGKEVTFEPKVLGLDGIKLSHGKFVWNFGDGASIVKSNQEKVNHTYKYAGEYVVTLSYFSNPYIISNTPDASDRVILNVQIHGLAITSFETDGTISIKNTDTKEFDLSNWVLASGAYNFTFPFGSIILPGKTLILASEISGIQNSGGQSQVTLKFPTGVLAVIFSTKQVPPISHNTSTPKSGTKSVITPEPDSSEISPLALTASAIDALPIVEKNSSKTWPIVLFVVLIASASMGVVFLRRRKQNDELTADDIAIMDS